jgi:sulfate adenylyltransferase
MGERADHGDGLVPPHGGSLAVRRLPAEAWGDAAARARERAALPVEGLVRADLELLASGGYSPLQGFMTERDYRSVVTSLHLAGGLVWSLPVVLPVEPALAEGLRPGQEVALVEPDGAPVALMTVEDRYRVDRAWEARHVFGTEDPRHPGVARLLRQPDVYVGGPVQVIGRRPSPFPRYDLEPTQTRAVFRERGWQTVVGFQTRNPIHRAHEYIQKCALELVDGLLLHPLVGETKGDDLPAEIRVRCYEALLDHYYPSQRVVLATFPAAMRYAGPREAVFHAICRKNYGCSHFIVGRDHAGVGGFYGPLDAQRLVRELAGEMGIQPLCYDSAFYCRRCDGMATAKTCPHGPEDRVELSGTQVREMLRRGELPPREYSRPEVAALLAGRSG